MSYPTLPKSIIIYIITKVIGSLQHTSNYYEITRTFGQKKGRKDHQDYPLHG